MTMHVVRLGEVCSVNMGQAPEGASYNEQGVGLPLIAGAGDFGIDYPHIKKFTSAPTKIAAPGDIIVSIRATIGTKVLSNGEFCLGRGVAGLRPKKGLDDRYLWHWLGVSQQKLASKGRGATFLQVSRADIEELELPLPRPEEQRRIAAILDKAEALRRKCKCTLELLEKAADGIVDEAFGSADSQLLIGDICDVQGGLQVTSARANLPIEIPYLRVANVHRNRIDLSEVKTMLVTEAELKRTLLIPNDILFVEGHGNATEIGRSAVWCGSIKPCIHQNHLIRARLKSKDISAFAVSRWLNGRFGRAHLIKRGKTTSGLNTISVSDVRTAPIPLLGQFEQQRLKKQLATIDEIKEHSIAKFRNAEALFVSLQHRAFTGQL